MRNDVEKCQNLTLKSEKKGKSRYKKMTSEYALSFGHVVKKEASYYSKIYFDDPSPFGFFHDVIVFP